MKNVCNTLFWVKSIVKRILFDVWDFFWETYATCVFANWVTPSSYFYRQSQHWQQDTRVPRLLLTNKQDTSHYNLVMMSVTGASICRRNPSGNWVILIFSGQKFHKNCDYTGKILKISCVRCNFVKFDIHFLGIPWTFNKPFHRSHRTHVLPNMRHVTCRCYVRAKYNICNGIEKREWHTTKIAFLEVLVNVTSRI